MTTKITISDRTTDATFTGNPAKETPLSGSDRRLVPLDADEALTAIKWARDHAEELEKFHRREGEYYAELPRSAGDRANAESYARMKQALTAILSRTIMTRAELVALINEEPEFPEPCPNLHALAEEAVAKGDTEWVIHMLRQAVRQTKECIINRLPADL